MRRLLLGLALLLMACGEVRGEGRVAFSQVEVQAYLEQEVARTLPGLEVGAATCPAELPRRIGAIATCTVVVERVPLDYEVQRLVADRFEARPVRPVIVVRDLVAAVRSKLGAQAASVACGNAPVAQPAPGQSLLCQISGPAGDRAAAVRVDADGNVTVTDP